MNRRILVTLCIFMLVLALAASPALAKKKGNKGSSPVSKGTILLGGETDLSIISGSTKVEPDGGEDVKTDEMSFGLGGLGGYFVMRGLEVGGLLNVDYTSEDEEDTETKSTEWLIGPQVGYFHMFGSSMSVFGLGALGYSKKSEETEQTVNNNKAKTEDTGSGWFFEPRGGIVYHVNNRVGLFASLFFRYTSGSGEHDDGNTTTDFDVTNTQFGLKAGVLGFL